MTSYPGLRAAIAADPEGVAAVLRTVRHVAQSPERAEQSPPLWAEVVRAIETESTWKPTAVNPVSGASGLIQWMPETAKALGTTVEALRGMSRAEQAPYVQKYLSRVAAHYKGLKRPGDLYVALAYPVALTYPPDKVIAEPGSAIWKQNPLWRDPQAGGAVTVRRLLEIGQPAPVDADLEGAVKALVPDLDRASTTIHGSAPKPAPAPAPSVPPGASVIVAPSGPPSTPPPPSTSSGAARRDTGGAALVLLLLAVAYGLRKGCGL